MIRELEFQLLCHRHRDDLYRYACGMLGDKTEAEDATQEVLLRLWRHLPGINLFTARAWLFRTARHCCIDLIRRRSHRAAPIAMEDDLMAQQMDELAIDPSAAADANSRMELARQALLKLPEAWRSVFVLYEVNGLRYREISAALGMPINTVKVNLLRARERLAKLAPKEEPWTTTCKN